MFNKSLLLVCIFLFPALALAKPSPEAILRTLPSVVGKFVAKPIEVEPTPVLVPAMLSIPEGFGLLIVPVPGGKIPQA